MNTIYIFFDNYGIRIPFYDYDKALFVQLIKSGLGHWENTGKQYHISRSSYDPDQLRTILSGKIYVEVGKEKDKPVIVHGFLSCRQALLEESEPIAIAEPKNCPGILATVDDLPEQLSDYWKDKLEVEMRSRKFSRHTRTAYTNNNQALCRWLQKKPEEVTSDDIKRYLAYMEKYKHYAAATLNSAFSAIKFFYGEVLKRDIANDQRRPRQDKRLPVVLAKSEIKKMLEGEQNLKHRLILMMVYGCGLRVSEIVKMRRQDIDPIRKVITVVSGKGRKDRPTIIPDMVIEALKGYYDQYKITDWVFPGAVPTQHLAIRTAQHVCKNALKRANIEKTASMHSLRHSFATHLLEGGIDITHIGRLLGHSSILTTARYTEVAKRKTLKITSPLDTIDQPDDDCDWS